MSIPIHVRFDPSAVDVLVLAAELPRDAERQVRRMRITGGALEKYRYIDGCDGCRLKSAGMKESHKHLQDCRRLLETAIVQDTEDREEHQKAQERISWRLAQRAEQKEGPEEVREPAFRLRRRHKESRGSMVRRCRSSGRTGSTSRRPKAGA